MTAKDVTKRYSESARHDAQRDGVAATRNVCKQLNQTNSHVSYHIVKLGWTEQVPRVLKQVKQEQVVVYIEIFSWEEDHIIVVG